MHPQLGVKLKFTALLESRVFLLVEQFDSFLDGEEGERVREDEDVDLEVKVREEGLLYDGDVDGDEDKLQSQTIKLWCK
jgi:hypothetical protein